MGPIIDAYNELQQLHHLGQAGLALLFKIAKEEVRRFPVLMPPGGWSEDSVWECAQAFFVEKGQAVTVGLLAQTDNLDSMGKYLRTSVRHFLADQARRTPVGAVRRKIEEILAATPRFVQVPTGVPGAGRWQPHGDPWPPYTGDLRSLVAAAYAVPGVRAVRWSGERRSPLASDERLTAIIDAVLMTAGGSLEVGQLTKVFLDRFPAAVEHADTALDQKVFDRASAPLEERPDVVVEVTDRAREVYGQLSPSQRALLPHLDMSVNDWMDVLNVGRSQAHAAAGKLRAHLAELIPEDELRHEVAAEVLHLCLGNP